jgi:hypothetical protein
MGWLDVLEAGAGYYNQDEAAKAALSAGEQSAERLYGLGEEVMGKTEFKPFTVTTGLGGATTDPTGGYALQMSPEQQALQNQLLGQSQTLFGQVGVDPSTAQADLYEQIRATQRPEEQRQRLALEERMLSQGRMGLSSSAYGGSSPELLAQETAIQEAMGRANLGARTQAMSEQKQALDAATGMMTQGYMPQKEALAALGYGMEGSKLALTGAGTGGQLFSSLGQSGIEALMQSVQLAQDIEAGKRDTLTEAIFGATPSLQEKILAEKYGVDLEADGGFMSSLGFGDAPTPQWIKDLNPFD